MKEIFKKRQQTLVTNVDIFLKRFVNFVLNIFAVGANSKFKFVRAAVSKIHSQTVTIKINFIESLTVNCFVNFYTFESVIIRFRVQTTE